MLSIFAVAYGPFSEACWRRTCTSRIRPFLLSREMAPAIAPMMAPSPGLAGTVEFLMYKFDASMPPRMAHRQQQRLTALTNGITDSKPRQTPPINAGFSLLFIAPVLANRAWIVNKFTDYGESISRSRCDRPPEVWGLQPFRL